VSRLSARGLVAGWGPSPVLHGADLEVAGGELVGVLGGNGSGKSTLLAVLSGLLRPRSGSVTLNGVRTDRLPAERVAAAGLRLLSQQRRVFASMTVEENLLSPLLAVGAVDAGHVHAEVDAWLERFPVLRDKRGAVAASLSGGQQQLVALGRVLAVPAQVLLLDEPSAGLSEAAETAVAEVLLARAAAGVGVVLVEQDVRFAERLAQRVLHLRGGVLTPG
jgi:branched-chain amino acid transport system ATP-binding protein